MRDFNIRLFAILILGIAMANSYIFDSNFNGDKITGNVVNDIGGSGNYHFEEGLKRNIISKGVVVANLEEGEAIFNHIDRLGNNRVQTDVEGAKIAEFKALPYGQTVLKSESRYEFTGKERDESGDHYFVFRYYDSSLGKFLSVDPVIENNAYGYVNNNPMKFVDPLGLDEFDPMQGDGAGPAIDNPISVDTYVAPKYRKPLFELSIDSDDQNYATATSAVELSSELYKKYLGKHLEYRQIDLPVEFRIGPSTRVKTSTPLSHEIGAHPGLDAEFVVWYPLSYYNKVGSSGSPGLNLKASNDRFKLEIATYGLIAAYEQMGISMEGDSPVWSDVYAFAQEFGTNTIGFHPNRVDSIFFSEFMDPSIANQNFRLVGTDHRSTPRFPVKIAGFTLLTLKGYPDMSPTGLKLEPLGNGRKNIIKSMPWGKDYNDPRNFVIE